MVGGVPDSDSSESSNDRQVMFMPVLVVIPEGGVDVGCDEDVFDIVVSGKGLFDREELGVDIGNPEKVK